MITAVAKAALNIVTPVVDKRKLDDVVDIFQEIREGKIQGRIVLDMKM